MTKAEEFVMLLIGGGGPKGGKREEKVPYAGPPPVEGQIYSEFRTLKILCAILALQKFD